MMEQLKCKSCGATLSGIGFGKYKCEYCGSVYKAEQSPIGELHFIEVSQAHAERIGARIVVPYTMRNTLRPEDISKYSIGELSRQLAEGLSAFMKLDVQEDPCQKATIVYGEVRVIPPDHRF